MSWATHKTILATSTALAATLIATSAFAGGFALREQSSYYQGMSFAGNGTTGPSISSVFWNPATITGAGDGITFEAHNTLIAPQAEIKGTNTVPNSLTTPTGFITDAFNTNDIGSDALIPSSYTAYKGSETFFLGLAITAPYGLSTKVDNQDWTGAGYNQSSKVFTINVNPIVGFKINEKLSIGFGPQLQYSDIRLRNAVASPSIPGATALPGQTLYGNGFGIGATAGITFKPTEKTEIGLGYRSAMFTKIGGNLVAALSPAAPTVVSDVKVETTLVTPDSVTLSAKHSFTDDIRVLGTFEWTNWSRLKQPKIRSEATGAEITSLPFNYNDGYFLSLGGEYDFNEKLTVRAGAAYEWSPIDTKIRSARLPDNDRIWVSGGASYMFNEHMSFDLGYTHIFGTDTDLDIVPGHQDYSAAKGSLTGTVDSSVDIVSASFRVRF
ncbi:long-chain fatty acid transport protein [Roseibium hamelinense]|uniref:Long-chain fatty acid transport protein n=1 Tax=Roseibium hamelinense TaxID=150831 RepID=A0A562TAT3_9HYPH|nr:OmpP1/FadL family transporter [Roseibium hamelinense]MTI45305.1 transporter [Roseibium hamelinense]TWI90328.1 long-chain fatty acid transport protein [Roseibium hamelinense]